MAKVDKSKLTKGKKKKWIPVLAPEIFNNSVVGETLQYEAEDALGRFLESNLMMLTRDLKSQNVNVKFQITEEKEGKLGSKIVAYYLVSASLRRIVRRKHTRLDESYSFKSKDGKRMRIKPLVLTRGKVSGSVESALRAKLKAIIYKFVSENDFDTVLKEIVFGKLQKAIKEQLSKIYPVKDAEIRIAKEESKAKAEKIKNRKEEVIVDVETPEGEEEVEETYEEPKEEDDGEEAEGEDSDDSSEEAAGEEAMPEEEPEEKPKAKRSRKKKEE